MDEKLVECTYCHTLNPIPIERAWCKKCGALLNPIPALLRTTVGKPLPPQDPSKCPYCAGDIEPGVLKCKHCGEWLDEEHRKKEDTVREAQVKGSSTARGFAAMIALLIALGFIMKACGG